MLCTILLSIISVSLAIYFSIMAGPHDQYYIKYHSVLSIIQYQYFNGYDSLR